MEIDYIKSVNSGVFIVKFPVTNIQNFKAKVNIYY